MWMIWNWALTLGFGTEGDGGGKGMCGIQMEPLFPTTKK